MPPEDDDDVLLIIQKVEQGGADQPTARAVFIFCWLFGWLILIRILALSSRCLSLGVLLVKVLLDSLPDQSGELRRRE